MSSSPCCGSAPTPKSETCTIVGGVASTVTTSEAALASRPAWLTARTVTTTLCSCRSATGSDAASTTGMYASTITGAPLGTSWRETYRPARPLSASPKPRIARWRTCSAGDQRATGGSAAAASTAVGATSIVPVVGGVVSTSTYGEWHAPPLVISASMSLATLTPLVATAITR